jgi:hypothetical protein
VGRAIYPSFVRGVVTGRGDPSAKGKTTHVCVRYLRINGAEWALPGYQCWSTCSDPMSYGDGARSLKGTEVFVIFLGLRVLSPRVREPRMIYKENLYGCMDLSRRWRL